MGRACKVRQAGAGQHAQLHAELAERVLAQHLADEREGVGQAAFAAAQHLGVAELDAFFGTRLDRIDAHFEQVAADPFEQRRVDLLAAQVFKHLTRALLFEHLADDPLVADVHGELADAGVGRQAVVERAFEARVRVVLERHVQERAGDAVHDGDVDAVGVDFEIELASVLAGLGDEPGQALVGVGARCECGQPVARADRIVHNARTGGVDQAGLAGVHDGIPILTRDLYASLGNLAQRGFGLRVEHEVRAERRGAAAGRVHAERTFGLRHGKRGDARTELPGALGVADDLRPGLEQHGRTVRAEQHGAEVGVAPDAYAMAERHVGALGQQAPALILRPANHHKSARARQSRRALLTHDLNDVRVADRGGVQLRELVVGKHVACGQSGRDGRRSGWR